MSELYKAVRNAVSRDKRVIDVRGKPQDYLVSHIGRMALTQPAYVWDVLDALLDHLDLKAYVERSIDGQDKIVIHKGKKK